MSVQSILLTGDDGYNAAGLRVLIAQLRDKYDLHVAGTTTQQSAVGGKMTLKGGFDWSLGEIDGIPALKVDGTPVDTMELASVYFKQKFDLVISGMNWGANLGTSIFNSGTVNAAFCALRTRLSPHAIAISWEVPKEFFTIDHTFDPIDKYLEYPGKMATAVIEMAIQKNFYDSTMLNINLPNKPTKTVHFCKMIYDATKVWSYQYPDLPRDGGHFEYNANRVFDESIDASFDVRAMTDGFITVTPCTIDITDASSYDKLQGEVVELE